MHPSVSPRANCASCGQNAVVPSPHGDFKHCFACGRDELAEPMSPLPRALADIAADMHAHLTAGGIAFDYLVKHGIHPQVILDSAVGSVPPDFDASARLLPVLQAAQAELATLEGRRGRGRPTKAEAAALAMAEMQLAHASKAQKQIGEFFDNRDGWFVFFYTGDKHDLLRLGAMSPDGGTLKYLQLGDSGGVFNHALFAPLPKARTMELLRGRNLVLMSELDVLQLQSLTARLAVAEDLRPEQGYVRAFAVGPDAIDASLVRRLGRMTLVIRNGGHGGGAQIVGQLRQTLNLFSAIGPATIEQLVRAAQSIDGALAALVELDRSKVLVTRPFDMVREEMDIPRNIEGPALKKFAADRWASQVLVSDLLERGQLFYDGRLAYVFEKDTNQLFPVDRDDTEMQLFLNRYGVAPGDAFAKQALNAVRLAAQSKGQQTTVYTLSHYDKKMNRVYLFNQDRHMYRISAKDIQRVPNGTDGVLFVKNPKWQAFEIGTSSGERRLLIDSLMGGMRLREQLLTRADQETLFETWFYSLFFPEVFPTRPLLAMIGEKGSGKTAVLRRIGQLLFGSNFQVMGMSHEPKDFDAAITGEAFVAIDNADTNIQWLEDKLAVVATGGALKRRLYYTTNKLVEFPITAFVALTSRTPHFRREDIADRLLLFNVERLETFAAESVLLQELASKRDALMTEVAGRVQQIVRSLDQKRGVPYPTAFRMADFARFALAIADAEGRLGEVEGTLQRATQEQLAFATQDDPVLEMIDRWLESSTNLGRQVTTAELFAELLDMSRNSRPTLPFDFKSAKGFGSYLAGAKGTLRELFGATDRTAGGRRHYWKFAKRMEGVEQEKEEPMLRLVKG